MQTQYEDVLAKSKLTEDYATPSTEFIMRILNSFHDISVRKQRRRLALWDCVALAECITTKPTAAVNKEKSHS